MIRKISDWMKHQLYLFSTKKGCIGLGILIGIVWFGIIWGWGTLNITNVDWLKGGDNGTSFFGWMFYKNSPWIFPIGLSTEVTYPFPLSIIYTDSIPLFALIFKILSPILPDIFQYHGIWIFCCLILEGIIGSLIVWCLWEKVQRRDKKEDVSKKAELMIAVGRLLTVICIDTCIILQPCMIQRVFLHTALASHWIILLAIYIWINKEYFSTWKRKNCAWGVTVVIATLVHMYFIPMVVVLMCGSLLDDSLRNRKNIIKNIVTFMFSCFCGIISLLVMGAATGNTVISGGLGMYCMNLNSLISGGTFSRIVPALPLAIDGQYEGAAYLGFGCIVLIVVSISLSLYIIFRKSIAKERIIQDYWNLLAGIFVIAIFLILALGTVVSFNEKIFFTWVYPAKIESLLKIFRSSGRMIWPVCYLLIIFASYLLLKSVKMQIFICILLGCTFIQIYDLSAGLGYVHECMQASLLYESVGFEDEFWNKILEEQRYRHIMIMDDNISRLEIAEFAVENKMTVNDFFASRKANNDISAYLINTMDELGEGMYQEDTLYIYSRAPNLEGDFYLYYTDPYFVVSSRPIDYEEAYCESASASDFSDYLLEISKLDDCIVILTARDEASNGLTDEMVNAMMGLGLIDFRGHFRDGYIAVLDDLNLVSEKFGGGVVGEEIIIKGVNIQMLSGWDNDMPVHSVLINNDEYSWGMRGMNVIVYDKLINQVVSNVWFDTYANGEKLR